MYIIIIQDVPMIIHDIPLIISYTNVLYTIYHLYYIIHLQLNVLKLTKLYSSIFRNMKNELQNSKTI